jgi:hypothetical protein
MANQLQIVDKEQWYDVSSTKWREMGADALLEANDGSPWRVLCNAYPDYPWKAWLFGSVPKGYWSKLENQRIYLKWLGEKCNIEKMDDWYEKIGIKEVVQYAGASLAKKYGYSMYKLLSAVFPYWKWQAWKFERVPNRFWENDENVSEYIRWMVDKLDVVTIQDLHSITTEDINHLRGSSLLNIITLDELKRTLFPQYFQMENSAVLQGRTSKNQLSVYKYLREILHDYFDCHDIIMGIKHPALSYADSKRQMELDIFAGPLNLALEYQGRQHFYFEYQGGSPKSQQKRDEEKKRACSRENITLIQIPFWWQKSRER